jgi:hypothetical protein
VLINKYDLNEFNSKKYYNNIEKLLNKIKGRNDIVVWISVVDLSSKYVESRWIQLIELTKVWNDDKSLRKFKFRISDPVKGCETSDYQDLTFFYN